MSPAKLIHFLLLTPPIPSPRSSSPTLPLTSTFSFAQYHNSTVWQLSNHFGRYLHTVMSLCVPFHSILFYLPSFLLHLPLPTSLPLSLLPLSLSLLPQPLGYQHCSTVISGWQKSDKLKHLFCTSVGEEEREKKRRQHLLEKFDVSVYQEWCLTHSLIPLSLSLLLPSPSSCVRASLDRTPR